MEIAPVENSNALAKSLRPGAEAAARGEYIVQFVRRAAETSEVGLFIATFEQGLVNVPWLGNIMEYHLK